MLPEFRILITTADDAATERRGALEAVSNLNDRYAGRAVLALDANPVEEAEIALVLVWNEANDVLEEVLERAADATDALLFVKTDPVPLDLRERDEVLRRLQARARLDALLAVHGDSFHVVQYQRDISEPITRELARILDTRLGIGRGPVDLRPRLDGTYLERPRLLRMLPDTPGHVVVLEAPYGYGKSVLAAQWAAQLEAEGHRILWTPPVEEVGALAPRLARALGIAPETPAGLIRARLWSVPTCVVIEDVQPDDDLAAILEDPQGFVLLAGREPLRDESLRALASRGRVTRLGAAELSFTREETGRLVGDVATADALQGTTLGWALPLHVASLTGAPPDPDALVAGIRASVADDAWTELLFLAALPYLPVAATRPETKLLVAKGFVQAVGSGYRLHPWFAQMLHERHRREVADAAVSQASRLPLLLQGEAFERVNDQERLAAVLAATEDELWRTAPTRLVAWDGLVKGFASARRDWTVGAAHQRLGAYQKAIDRLRSALAAQGLTPNERLGIMREMCVPFGVLDPDAGRAMLEEAERWIPDADASIAARFLGNAAILHAHAGDPEEAVRAAERALAAHPPDSPHRVASEVNLALFRWDLHGDFEGRLHAQLATLDRVSETYRVQALGQCRDIGMFHAWLGEWDTARAYLERAAGGEATNPAVATEARAELAYLDGDRGVVAAQLRKALLFPDPSVADMVSMYQILLDLEAGDLKHAERTYANGPRGSFSACGYARVLAARGDTTEALTLLDGITEHDRPRRLYLAAARYLVTRESRDLEAFLRTTTAGPRLLPGFLPFATLPDDPAYAIHYPVAEVLRSGHRKAIAARAADVPPLRIDLLGTFDVRVLGDPVDLTGRQRQILTLLLLGLSRDEVAEAMWPEAGNKKQRNNLNVQLAALRKVIEPWGLPSYLGDGGLRHVTSDFLDLRAALDEGNPRATYDLFREPFAPGIDLGPVEEERLRLREEAVSVLYEGSDEAPEAEDRLLRVLELEPLHEEALQRLMRALVRRGRRREALLRYQRFEAHLRTDLDLEPLAETRAILDA